MSKPKIAALAAVLLAGCATVPDTKPVAIHATDAAPRPPLLTYPEPLNSQLLRRVRQPLARFDSSARQAPFAPTRRRAAPDQQDRVALQADHADGRDRNHVFSAN